MQSRLIQEKRGKKRKYILKKSRNNRSTNKVPTSKVDKYLEKDARN